LKQKHKNDFNNVVLKLFEKKTRKKIEEEERMMKDLNKQFNRVVFEEE
jgi:hypothetical protein